MRALTWNLWWQFGARAEREAAILDVIDAEQPDVILLQEVWSQGTDSSAGRIAARLGFDHALTEDPIEQRRGGRPGFHNAIVSRWPLDDVITHPLPGPNGTVGVRRALSAALTSRTGLRWHLVSLHLDYQFDASALRQRQCEALLRIVAGIRDDPEQSAPVVVGGDFNATPDSDEIRMLTGRRDSTVPGVVLSDCWEHVGEGAGATWRSDNPYQAGTTWPNRRLDYVFVSWPRPKPLGNPIEARLVGVEPVRGIVPSDHAGVVVDLIDEPAAPQPDPPATT
jgi:endonuclease/exonuclease/phosphatase family metal-dependent hydrolase